MKLNLVVVQHGDATVGDRYPNGARICGVVDAEIGVTTSLIWPKRPGLKGIGRCARAGRSRTARSGVGWHRSQDKGRFAQKWKWPSKEPLKYSPAKSFDGRARQNFSTRVSDRFRLAEQQIGAFPTARTAKFAVFGSGRSSAQCLAVDVTMTATPTLRSRPAARLRL